MFEPRRISFFALFILCFFYYTPLAQTRKTAFWKWDQHGLNRIFPENKRDWDFFGKMAKPGSHREKNGAKCARLGPFWVRLFRPLLLWWRLFAEYYISVTGGAKCAIWTQKKVQYINGHEINRLKAGLPTGFREKTTKKTTISDIFVDYLLFVSGIMDRHDILYDGHTYTQPHNIHGHKFIY